MESLFLRIIGMSAVAAIIAAVVIVLRLFLKKSPKWISCALWGLVALRLILPFSFESRVGVVPKAETISESVVTAVDVRAESVDLAKNAGAEDELPHIAQSVPGHSTSDPADVMKILSAVWIAGVGLMIAYMIFSYVSLKLKVRESLRSEGNIYLCDKVGTPFILGVVRPKIYLPSVLNESDAVYVIAHERAHLKRFDHIWKPLGYILLSVHWFNPALWLAYILLCRDIESACDEKVISEAGDDVRGAYSTALINCSMPRRSVSACPLAFGESGVQSRIKTVLNYKKPAFWIIVISVIAVAALSVFLLIDRAGGEEVKLALWDEDETPVSVVYEVRGDEGLPFTVTDPEEVKTLSEAAKNILIGDETDDTDDGSGYGISVTFHTDKGNDYKTTFVYSSYYYSFDGKCFETLGVSRLNNYIECCRDGYIIYGDKVYSVDDVRKLEMDVRSLDLWDESDGYPVKMTCRAHFPDNSLGSLYTIEDPEVIKEFADAASAVQIGDEIPLSYIDLYYDLEFVTENGKTFSFSFCGDRVCERSLIGDIFDSESFETLGGARIENLIGEYIKDRPSDGQGGTPLPLWSDDEKPVKIVYQTHGWGEPPETIDDRDAVDAISKVAKQIRFGDIADRYTWDGDVTYIFYTDEGNKYSVDFNGELYSPGANQYETVGYNRMSWLTLYYLSGHKDKILDTEFNIRSLGLWDESEEYPVKMICREYSVLPEESLVWGYTTEDLYQTERFADAARAMTVGDEDSFGFRGDSYYSFTFITDKGGEYSFAFADNSVCDLKNGYGNDCVSFETLGGVRFGELIKEYINVEADE